MDDKDKQSPNKNFFLKSKDSKNLSLRQSPQYSSEDSNDDEDSLPNWCTNRDEYWGEGQCLFAGEYEENKDNPIPCKSETEETPSSEANEKSNARSGSSSEILSNVYSKLSPFSILWSFGVNTKVDIINLTKSDVFEVFYVSSHFGVIYDYSTNSMRFLPGHNYPVTSIAADKTGRWLVTADAGEDTVIIIWDKDKRLPAWSLYNVFPGGVKCVKISQDARFLAAVNRDFNYSVKFWLWTYGRDDADGTVELDPVYGRVKHIDFNHMLTQQFVVTIEFGVTFCEWDFNSKNLKTFTPNFDFCRKKIGRFRESIFLDDKHTTLTTTSQGYVIVWCDVKYNEPIDEDKHGTIDRKYLKSVKLHETGITSIKLCDRMIATSSEEGIIFFHDQYLRLMYCFPRLRMSSISCISFNIDYVSCSSDPFSSDFTKTGLTSLENEEIQNIYEYDSSDEELLSEKSKTKNDSEILKDKSDCELLQPKDCTLERREFIIRDFIFLLASGKIGYLSHKRKKVKYFLYEAKAPVLSMDCNPTKSHIAVGYECGQIVLYEYQNRKILITQTFSCAITTLKYSSMGHSLMAGLKNGELYELDPLLLSIKNKIDSSKSPLMKICFSSNDDILAFYDQSSTVHVYKKRQSVWISQGKYTSHYRPIADMLFEKPAERNQASRLFTLGTDRMLVEYDMKHLEDNKLKILSITRIEQSAIPCCFTLLTKMYKNPHFLVSNNQYKLKVFDVEQRTCSKTTLGPTADTPINFMKILKTDSSNVQKMIYTTEKHIGIRILPPTGNPFEGMGMVAHPQKLLSISISHDHRYVFTSGINDFSPLMWEINLDSVDVAAQLGGNGLEPFVSLIEGGSNSFLFKEIEDFFYYAQIIHQGEDPNLDRSVAKNLALCEIPDMFRALGFYPTDYEVANLIHELKHMDYETTGVTRSEISFEECVKAFLNHRPVQGISLTDIHNALMAIADSRDPTDIIIEPNELYKALEERAEAMDHPEVVGYLCILLLPKDETNPLPLPINIWDFGEQVFGIDLSITEGNVREITHAFENKN